MPEGYEWVLGWVPANDSEITKNKALHVAGPHSNRRCLVRPAMGKGFAVGTLNDLVVRAQFPLCGLILPPS